ncbi:metal ABC transporter substrate-binding protein [Planctomycetota bacterium]|nr:metal ABC transporter substrate-binding protein [Planctomycetota bacterium]
MKLFVLSMVTAVLLSACGQPDVRKLEEGQTLRIVVSSPHLACLALNVAGDLAEVESLLPENANPHSYDPATKDREKIQNAHLLAINGLGLEPWDAEKLAHAAGATLVDCGDLPASFLIKTEDEEHDEHEGHDHAHGTFNPHVWLCTEGAYLQAEVMCKAMQKMDTANAEAYGKNLAEFKERMDALKHELNVTLDDITARKFASNHDAFPYFANEFALSQVGVVQLTPGDNPSVSERAKLIETIKRTGAKAIFLEVGFDEKAATAIAEQAEIQLGRLDPIATGKPTRTLIEDALRANAKEAARVLGG